MNGKGGAFLNLEVLISEQRNFGNQFKNPSNYKGWA